MTEIEDKLRKAYVLERGADLIEDRTKLEPREEFKEYGSGGGCGLLVGGALATVGGVLGLGPWGALLLPVGSATGIKIGNAYEAHTSMKKSDRLIIELGDEGIVLADDLRYKAIEELLGKEIKGGCCTRHDARGVFDRVHSYATLGSWEEKWHRGWYEHWTEEHDTRVALKVPRRIWVRLEEDPAKVVEAYDRLERKLHGYCSTAMTSTTGSNCYVSRKVLDAAEKVMAKEPDTETIEKLEFVVSGIPEKELYDADIRRRDELLAKI